MAPIVDPPLHIRAAEALGLPVIPMYLTGPGEDSSKPTTWLTHKPEDPLHLTEITVESVLQAVISKSAS